MCVLLNGMDVEEFFELFVIELKHHPELQKYYKFLASPSRLAFRQAYFCQRLDYLHRHIGPTHQQIWDCGSGFGTTGFFLAMNGYKVHGSTLEFYINELEQRRAYWARYGNAALFSWSYEDIYSVDYHQQFDTIILQDTLHHLEPIDKAFHVFYRALKPDGQLLVIEENGSNIIQSLKLIRQRGFRKVKDIYDERLQKTIQVGDENIRGVDRWTQIMERNRFTLDQDSLQYIRLLPPGSYHNAKSQQIFAKEQRLASRLGSLKNYLYFGINFTARKKF